MNKKGDEIVEAAMVLPILILTVLSLIMLMLYFFTCINTQVDMHKSLIKESLTSSAIFDINENEIETSSKTGGVVSLIMSKEMKSRVYEMDKASIIRAGKMLGFDGE